MSTRLTRTATAVENLFDLRKVSAALATFREGGHSTGPNPDGVTSRVALAMAQVNGLAVADVVTKGGMLATAGAMAVAGLAAAVRMDPSVVSGAIEAAKFGAAAVGGGLVGLAATGAHEQDVGRLVVVREAVRSDVAAKEDRLRALQAEVLRLRDVRPLADVGHRDGINPLRDHDSSATLDGENDHITPGGP